MHSTNDAFMFRKRTIKEVMPKEKREELVANIEQHVKDFLKSGGKVQHCTPFAYGAPLGVTARQRQLNNTKVRKIK